MLLPAVNVNVKEARVFRATRSAATSITLFSFELFIPHSAERMSEKTRKKHGEDNSGKTGGD